MPYSGGKGIVKEAHSLICEAHMFSKRSLYKTLQIYQCKQLIWVSIFFWSGYTQ